MSKTKKLFLKTLNRFLNINLHGDKISKLIVQLFSVLLLWSLAPLTLASTTGPSMPWDNGFKVVSDALTGGTAHALIVISIAIAGIGFAVGEQGSMFRKAMAIIAGGSVAVGATSLYMTLQLGGAVV